MADPDVDPTTAVPNINNDGIDLESCIVLSEDEASSLHEGENNSEVPEVIELKLCCRCSQVIGPSEEVFDTDSCAHHVCVGCRFREDLNCSVCNPHCQNSINSSQDKATDKIPTNFLKDYAVSVKRNTITTDHIVNVELSTAEGSVQRQMCSVCQRVFKSSNARYHYMCASGDKPFTCVQCGKKFVKKSHVEAHLNSHYGIKPFKCTVEKCTASFYQKDKLVRHIKAHNKDEKYMCAICDKTYSSQSILHFHMVKVHSSAKPFQCDHCPRSYKYEKSLRIHKLKHQVMREYMCEICGKKYSLFAQLKYHKRSHIVYHRRPHKCFCSRRFMTKQDKARHQLTHNSSRDFECSLCNTTFGRKDNLERHMKNFHENNLPKSGKVAKLTAIVSPFNKIPNVTKTKKLAESQQNKQNISSTLNTAQKVVRDKRTKMIQRKSIKESKPVSPNDELSKLAHSEQCSLEKLMEKLDEPMPTVIVSPKPSETQQRPSVIKSIPKLLPYRILPPDKRFLVTTDENNYGKRPSDLMPPPVLKKSCDRPKTKRSTTHKPKVPKDDALNRCFRIIHHTSSVQQPIKEFLSTEKLVNDRIADFNEPVGAIAEEESDKNSRISVPSLLLTPTITLDQGICQLSSDESPFTPSPLDNCSVSSKCLGGPTLPTSLPEVLEASDTNPVGDSFSYIPLGESSCSTYTPYFDSDCFRDGVNNCYEDFDMGFQYINEHFSHAEVNLSTEAKSVKYVSQETIVVKKC